MSCTEAHSRTEWYSWPPVNRFGVGRPFSLSIEPSVPPRIGSRTGSMPSARIARSATSTTCGNASTKRRMFGYCGRSVTVDARARLLRGDRLGGAADQRDVLGEQRVVEVARDEADLRAPRVAGEHVRVDEALAVAAWSRA